MALSAKLHIETAVRQGRTILEKSFCSAPFRIADVTEDRERGQLRLMFMSSSPGILDGDHYELKIRLGEASDVSIETQAFQRIFHMAVGAEQSLALVMKAGSSLIYLPHPVVPHKNAIYKSKTKITLHPGCSLQWAEIICCGRGQSSEVFQFQSYHSLTEIFYEDKLVVRENVLLLPMEIDPYAIGQLEGFTHQGSLLYWSEKADTKGLEDLLVERMKAVEGISFGVSALPRNGLMVRILGYKAEQLFRLIKELSSCIEAQPIQQRTKKVADVTG